MPRPSNPGAVLYTDLCYALDPVAFTRDRLAFDPDPSQSLVLATRSKQVILNCTRQWGKSTVTAARAIFTARHEPDSLILVLSPTSRQSSELVRKASAFLRRLGIRPRGDGSNEHSLLLPNQSCIVGLPGTEGTVRGFSGVRLLLVDEASCVEEDLYLAMRPVLAASDGDVWLISTPFGRRGFFYQTWGLERDLLAMGDRWYAQEYLCEFAENEQSLFPQDLIRKAIKYDLKPPFQRS